MSSEADHIAHANRDQGTLDHLLLDSALNAEWIATVAFYKRAFAAWERERD